MGGVWEFYFGEFKPFNNEEDITRMFLFYFSKIYNMF